MSRKFKVGDRVRIVGHSVRPYLNGTVATVIAGPVSHCTVSGRVYSKDMEAVYELDMRHPEPMWSHTNLGVSARNLVPIYDGHERTSWSDCVWQPKNVEVR